MDFPLKISLLILLWIETVLGILLNAFIVAMAVIRWLESNNLQMIDFMLANVGMSRVALLISWEFIYPYVPTNTALLGVTAIFLSLWSLWSATILCVFYCVKICHYQHWFFMYLKLNMCKLVQGLFLVSVASSLIFSLTFKWLVYTNLISNSTNSTAQGSIIVEVNNANQFLLILTGFSVPLFIFCVAVTILIRSLWTHARNMAGADFINPQLQAHLSAVKNMISFLFFYIVFFGVVVVASIPSLVDDTVLQLVFNILCCSYPLLHSLILVLNHRRLREALYWCFHCKFKTHSTHRNAS
ncbi:hypothetical protein XELAEV_18028387mg [Xenopus laevis]|nr:hypothetical protein XELAEV_18028387mg [Xenopus laevis]